MDVRNTTAGATRAERRAAARAAREARRRMARQLAEPYDGVLTRRMLLDVGVTREQIRAEVEAGAWHKVGWHTLSVTGPVPTGRALWWTALWESGGAAVLDGVTSLLASGLTGWTEELIHISVPHASKVRRRDGVRHHHPRVLGPTMAGGVPRTRPEVATVRAAIWATTPRQAATIVAMAVQQRLVRAEALLARWREVGHVARRGLLDAVIGDVCDGAHSLGELDFARLCREAGLPAPERQAMRIGEGGRVYLDVWWDSVGVHVEIQGAQHYEGLAMVDDALRQNALALGGVRVSLQVPVLGLRLRPQDFLGQVARALDDGRRRVA